MDGFFERRKPPCKTLTWLETWIQLDDCGRHDHLTGVTRHGIAWSWSSTNSAFGAFLRRRGALVKTQNAERRFCSLPISNPRFPIHKSSKQALQPSPMTQSSFPVYIPSTNAIASSLPHSWRELYWLCFHVLVILQAVVPVTTSPVVSLPGATSLISLQPLLLPLLRRIAFSASKHG